MGRVWRMGRESGARSGPQLLLLYGYLVMGLRWRVVLVSML